MTRRLRHVLAAFAGVLLAALAAVLVAGREHGGGERPPARVTAAPPPKVFAFVSGHDGAELRRLERVGDRIDVIAPNWYGLDAATGALQRPSRPGPLARTARGHGVDVWPTVNARTAGSSAWEPAAARAGIVRALLAAATRHGAVGATLDMEELRPDQRAAFVALVREAAARLHAAGRKLAVYVPRPGPGSAAAYDWAALGAEADLLLCAGYNEHWAGGPPGPTTTTRGFAAVLDRMRALPDADRAVPLLGAFGYRWEPAGGGTLISTADAGRLRRDLGAAATRADGAERFSAGGDAVVYETAAGLRARAAAARASGVRWLGLFSLGREPAGFWSGLATDRRPFAR